MRILLAALLAMQLLTAYDIVFILQDAGDAQALLPVIDVCLRNHEDIFVLTGGPASDILRNKINTLSFDQLDIPEKLDRTWERDSLLSSESINTLLDQFPAKRVVSGVTYDFYEQLLEAYAGRGTITFAYWDNIDDEETTPSQAIHHLLVSSPPLTNLHPHVSVVGQPSLELVQMDEIDPAKIRSQLPFPLQSPIIVFFGDYEITYAKALEQFLKAAEEIPSCTILLSPHPRTDGALERESLTSHPLSNVYLIEPAWNISATEIAALANHILCHSSSTGIHAALAEKQPIYWTSIENGSLLKKLLATPDAPLYDLFKTLQIPRDSARLIYDSLSSVK